MSARRDLQVSQFSDPSIPMAAAMSLCGPAAAVAFSRVNGRGPTLREAQALAEKVGWTAAAGMAGPRSQQALLSSMGVQSELRDTADWRRITADAQAGRPTTISTPRHYFTVSDYDPATGKYYVGTSGTDLRGGSAWLSADEIASQGRGINGVLHYTGAVPTEQQRFDEANASRTDARPPAVTSGPSAGVSAPAGAPAAPAVALPKPLEEDPVQKILAEQEKARKRANAALYAQRIASYGPDQTPNVFRLPEPEAPTLRVPSFRLPSLAEMIG
jgi:hypothetical protein